MCDSYDVIYAKNHAVIFGIWILTKIPDFVTRIYFGSLFFKKNYKIQQVENALTFETQVGFSWNNMAIFYRAV